MTVGLINDKIMLSLSPSLSFSVQCVRCTRFTRDTLASNASHIHKRNAYTRPDAQYASNEQQRRRLLARTVFQFQYALDLNFHPWPIAVHTRIRQADTSSIFTLPVRSGRCFFLSKPIHRQSKYSMLVNRR